jgi:hypothetical protein
LLTGVAEPEVGEFALQTVITSLCYQAYTQGITTGTIYLSIFMHFGCKNKLSIPDIEHFEHRVE